MAALLSLSTSPLLSKFYIGKTALTFSPRTGRFSITLCKLPQCSSYARLHFRTCRHLSPLLATSSPLSSIVTRASSNGFLDTTEEDEIMPSFEERPVKFVVWVLIWASLSVAWFAASGDANAAAAAADSIKASSFGLKIASALRGLGWPDEAAVFALATLPVLELRGAIPVGYWMQLKPVNLTVLSVLWYSSFLLFQKLILIFALGCIGSYFNQFS